ncbi:hypothetical protein ACJX4N_002488 [Enterococcus faecalis]|uniref:hypothetical protein n=1 Tax=Enterococcus faecalis TaxID=1351 RepID=UPI0012E1D355|nr:hypothetical protein [Enterococcus faecalis]EGO5016448.1 hypothetical protein [Enterococcus faecalis]EGO6562256.1 hypothetical protein [Enterococcus faecalis]EGO7560213.1 hypothetical protein [Enterococcus faecalis]EGO7742211.1 hypothetical protein [Enterococcus faecalis]EGO8387377.1 hypothetical protein [Enterococcus faecalis]
MEQRLVKLTLDEWTTQWIERRTDFIMKAANNEQLVIDYLMEEERKAAERLYDDLYSMEEIPNTERLDYELSQLPEELTDEQKEVLLENTH